MFVSFRPYLCCICTSCRYWLLHDLAGHTSLAEYVEIVIYVSGRIVLSIDFHSLDCLSRSRPWSIAPSNLFQHLYFLSLFSPLFLPVFARVVWRWFRSTLLRFWARVALRPSRRDQHSCWNWRTKRRRLLRLKKGDDFDMIQLRCVSAQLCLWLSVWWSGWLSG